MKASDHEEDSDSSEPCNNNRQSRISSVGPLRDYNKRDSECHNSSRQTYYHNESRPPLESAHAFAHQSSMSVDIHQSRPDISTKGESSSTKRSTFQRASALSHGTQIHDSNDSKTFVFVHSSPTGSTRTFSRRPSKEDRIYPCEFDGCDKRYSNTHSRRQHYRRQHKEEWDKKVAASGRRYGRLPYMGSSRSTPPGSPVAASDTQLSDDDHAYTLAAPPGTASTQSQISSHSSRSPQVSSISSNKTRTASNTSTGVSTEWSVESAPQSQQWSSVQSARGDGRDEILYGSSNRRLGSTSHTSSSEVDTLQHYDESAHWDGRLSTSSAQSYELYKYQQWQGPQASESNDSRGTPPSSHNVSARAHHHDTVHLSGRSSTMYGSNNSGDSLETSATYSMPELPRYNSRSSELQQRAPYYAGKTHDSWHRMRSHEPGFIHGTPPRARRAHPLPPSHSSPGSMRTHRRTLEASDSMELSYNDNSTMYYPGSSTISNNNVTISNVSQSGPTSDYYERPPSYNRAWQSSSNIVPWSTSGEYSGRQTEPRSAEYHARVYARDNPASGDSVTYGTRYNSSDTNIAVRRQLDAETTRHPQHHYEWTLPRESHRTEDMSNRNSYSTNATTPSSPDA